jgi:RES domain-containing protein
VTPPLPGALGGTDLIGWRLDARQFAPSWDSGEGAFRFGGRWNSVGTRAVYCSLDPATTILEVAVHRGFKRMDTSAHVLTSFRVADPKDVFVLQAEQMPNPNWLRSGQPSAGQQAFGDELLKTHRFILVPSVVSTNSWNIVFVALRAHDSYQLRSQDAFALDTRLYPPA